MPLFDLMQGHSYTLSAIGTKRKLSRVFKSREQANAYMYDYCGRKGYRITRVWDDKHNKTYICDGDNVRFFICRA